MKPLLNYYISFLLNYYISFFAFHSVAPWRVSLRVESGVKSDFTESNWSLWQGGSLSISSVMIIRIQSVHAPCVASFTVHVRRRNITGPLENCLDMCWKPQSERVSVKMKLTH